MTGLAKNDVSPHVGLVDTPAHWEQRSTRGLLDTRRTQALERGRRIVEAANALLEEQGLEGLTIRAVLKKTGLSRRAFYERFADKDELVLAVFEETLRLATHQFDDEVRALADPVARLKVIITCIVLGKSSLRAPDRSHNTRRAAAMSREHLRLAESRPTDLHAALSSLVKLISRQLADGMRLKLVRQDDPQRLAALIYNLVATTVHSELLMQKDARTDWPHRTQLAADIWEFCRRAISA